MKCEKGIQPPTSDASCTWAIAKTLLFQEAAGRGAGLEGNKVTRWMSSSGSVHEDGGFGDQLLMPDLLWCMVPLLDNQQMLALLLCCKEAASAWRGNDALQVRWLLCEQEKQDEWAACHDGVDIVAERLRPLREQLAISSCGAVSWTSNTRLKSLVSKLEQLVQHKVHSAEAAGMTPRQGAGSSSVARAIRSRRPQLLQLLLQQGVQGPGRPGTGSSPSAGLTEQQQLWCTRALIELAAAGSAEFVQTLLAARPSVNKPLPSGRTALAAAALAGHTDCVRLLLQDFVAQPLPGKMALRAAACLSCSTLCRAQNIACLGVLMMQGAEGYAFRCALDTPGAVDELYQTSAQGGDPWLSDSAAAAGRTLAAAADNLVRAAVYMEPTYAPCAACMAALLTVHGVDPNVQGWFMRTPLMNASCWGLSACVATLLAHPRTDVNREDSDGFTALWGATRWGWCDVVERLLAAPDVKLAIRIKVARPLLNAKLLTDVRDAAVNLPLVTGISYCIFREQAQCIRLLQTARRRLPRGSLEQRVGPFWWRVYLLPSQLISTTFAAAVEACDGAAAAVVAGLWVPRRHRRRTTALLTNASLIGTTFALALAAELAWGCMAAASARGRRIRRSAAYSTFLTLTFGPMYSIFVPALAQLQVSSTRRLCSAVSALARPFLAAAPLATALN